MTAYSFYYNYAGTLKTKCGNELELYTALSDYTDEQKESAIWGVENGYPGAEVVGEATSAYNGYSYALYNHTTSNDRCIFDIDAYVSDPHVVRDSTGLWDDCEVGDVVIYFGKDGNPVQAGIISEVNGSNTKIISKWDSGCLVEHLVSQIPSHYYYDEATLITRAFTYTVTSHSYTVTSYTSSKHTYTCSVCNDQYSEAHTLNGLGSCRYCGYSSSGGLTPVLPED